MSIQRKADRFRKGSVIVVDTIHSYHKQQPYMERVEYHRVRLDRVVASVADNVLGRRIIKTERLGSVNVKNAPTASILVLDADVRAEDLWRDHAETEWPSVAEAKPIITQYRTEVPA